MSRASCSPRSHPIQVSIPPASSLRSTSRNLARYSRDLNGRLKFFLAISKVSITLNGDGLGKPYLTLEQRLAAEQKQTYYNPYLR